jgi:hypothetical protein
MKSSTALLCAAALALVGCGKRDQASAPETTSSPAAGQNPITAPVDYLGAVGKAQKAAVKTIDTVSIDQAIRMFQVEEGRLPKDLNELVQEHYLPTLPTPPAGMKFQYDARTGRVSVVPQ